MTLADLATLPERVRAESPTSLYRHFAADGSLLYVGISLSWPARTKAHAQGSRWFEQVARVEIERFPSRAAALDAEREAIKREKPKFNVVHNRPTAKFTSKQKVADAHLSRWVKVGASTGRPAPKCCRCKAGVGSSGKWYNAVTGQHMCKRCHEEWRHTITGGRQADPILRQISGPDAIVGPALIYSGEKISVLIAHGEFGTAGELTELVLGEHFPDLPEWTDACASVLTLRRPNEITMSEARQTRSEIIAKLRRHLRTVQAYDTDLALAVAYASQFPSEKSRRVLDQVATEKGAAA